MKEILFPLAATATTTTAATATATANGIPIGGKWPLVFNGRIRAAAIHTYAFAIQNGATPSAAQAAAYTLAYQLLYPGLGYHSEGSNIRANIVAK